MDAHALGTLFCMASNPVQSPVMPGGLVSIVVPTFREAENLAELADRAFAAFDSSGLRGEMIVVDDDSRDGTIDVVRRLASKHPIRLITRTQERGLSSAVLCGFGQAKGEILVCMDADLSHPPESLPDLIAPIAAGSADFAIGSRYVAGGRTKEDWGAFRKLNSLVATWLARPLTDAQDPMAGFFCLRRETLRHAEAAGLDPIGYKIALEILVKSQCGRVVEIPIEFSDRLHGKSKLTPRQQWLYLRHLWRLYRFCYPTGARLGMIGAVLLLVLIAAKLLI